MVVFDATRKGLTLVMTGDAQPMLAVNKGDDSLKKPYTAPTLYSLDDAAIAGGNLNNTAENTTGTHGPLTGES